MIIYLPLLLVVITVPLYAASTTPKNMTYSMEKGPSFQSICGRNVLVPVNGYKHKLVSMGNAGGNCFATLMVGLNSKLTCKICVSLEEKTDWNLEDDFVNITFTGEVENILLKFGHDNFNETCFEGRLDILVVEDEEYARKRANGDNANEYSFKFALKPKCSEEPICKSSVPINSSSDSMVMTYSDTKDKVIVALSFTVAVLVIVVLVLLVNFYCYHKQPVCKSKNQQKKPKPKDTSSEGRKGTETNEAKNKGSGVCYKKDDVPESAKLMDSQKSKPTADNKDKGNK